MLSEFAMKPHEQRVIDEKAELDERCNKLHQFVVFEGAFRSLNACERLLLREQLEAMREYQAILGARIALFEDAKKIASASHDSGVTTR